MPYIPYIPYIGNMPYHHSNHTYHTDHTYCHIKHTIPNRLTYHTYHPYNTNHSCHTYHTYHTYQTYHTFQTCHTRPTIHTIHTQHTIPHPHHTTGGEGDSATPPPHHRGGRGKISYGASIWDPSHGGWGEGGVAGPGAYIYIYSHEISIQPPQDRRQKFQSSGYPMLNLYINLHQLMNSQLRLHPRRHMLTFTLGRAQCERKLPGWAIWKTCCHGSNHLGRRES